MQRLGLFFFWNHQGILHDFMAGTQKQRLGFHNHLIDLLPPQSSEGGVLGKGHFPCNSSQSRAFAQGVQKSVLLGWLWHRTLVCHVTPRLEARHTIIPHVHRDHSDGSQTHLDQHRPGGTSVRVETAPEHPRCSLCGWRTQCSLLFHCNEWMN